jgi:anti-sigma B factor antagonist
MEIQTRKQDAVTVFELTGRFDAYEVPRLMEALEAPAQENEAKLLVNLSAVNFIDSSGLAALVQYMKRCREHGGDLRLSNLMQPVRIIFELTRLDKAFAIFPDETAALADW